MNRRGRESELLRDVGLDERVRWRERHDRCRPQGGQPFAEEAIVRPEVVAHSLMQWASSTATRAECAAASPEARTRRRSGR